MTQPSTPDTPTRAAAAERRLSVAQALDVIVQDVRPTDVTAHNLDECPGRTLAQDTIARLTQPPANVSSMDGYAIAHSDADRGELTVIGESAAGHPFVSTVEPGECVRIFTGAVLPQGTDTVVIQEDVTRETDEADTTTITLNVKPQRHEWVRRRGIDFAEGDVGLRAGTLIAPRHLGLAAAMGHAALPVHRKPRVAILATGDELVPPGAIPGDGQIISSNPHALEALMIRFGADVDMLGIATDDLDDLARHLARADDADLLITIGGASVGDHDLVHTALQAFGIDMQFWKINMRPGKPLMYGRKPDLHVIGVPGNPVSSMICARLFAVPLAQRLSGQTEIELAAQHETLRLPLPANGPREHYMRATLTEHGVTPAPSQDSSLQSVLAASNALIVRPANADAVETGEIVPVIPIDF